MDNDLTKYTVNFTQLAKDGKLDPVIGRDEEIRRVMQVLSRRTKNNPVLIGEPGVGKTAIIEGLAQRIINGDVPSSLKNKQILSLEMASVLAGAKYRGEFEERLKNITNEVQKQAGEIILFIDELHTVVGAGGADGAIDASNMLKPGLARGTLRLIGATTLNEYREYIEKDSALERRFQPVLVSPPNVIDTISILRGLKEKYELHHGIRIHDDALIAAAELSDRYISDRFLPDKAIDLVDEAASGLKIEAESKPRIIDQTGRTITQIEIELKALRNESTKTNLDKITSLELELNQLKTQQQQDLDRYHHQKQIIEQLQQVKHDLDKAKAELDIAEREVDLDKAARIKYGDIPKYLTQLEQIETKWQQIPTVDKLIKQEVDAEDIAAVVSRWSGIPIARLQQTETEKLKHLETQLGKRVVGQTEALTAVSNAIRRSRTGIAEENRPLASFLFLGPTGVGKTETAKALAEALFDSDKAMIRLDMSEFSQSHTVARLIGAPPGYIGYEQGGQLTEPVRRHPYSVILLDEIEKAHPQIFTIFLQIFDEGRLTDGQGRTVNFKNTIIIMTSNLDPKLVEPTFPPEFINRLDQIIVFEPLTPDQLSQIVDIQIERVTQRLLHHQIELNLSPEAKKYLAETGYDPVYGARPLKRLIQTKILDPLALMMLDYPDTKLRISVTKTKSGIKLVHDSVKT